jgi:hypothetical protein
LLYTPLSALIEAKDSSSATFGEPGIHAEKVSSSSPFTSKALPPVHHLYSYFPSPIAAALKLDILAQDVVQKEGEKAGRRVPGSRRLQLRTEHYVNLLWRDIASLRLNQSSTGKWQEAKQR